MKWKNEQWEERREPRRKQENGTEEKRTVRDQKTTVEKRRERGEGWGQGTGQWSNGIVCMLAEGIAQLNTQKLNPKRPSLGKFFPQPQAPIYHMKGLEHIAITHAQGQKQPQECKPTHPTAWRPPKPAIVWSNDPSAGRDGWHNMTYAA